MIETEGWLRGEPGVLSMATAGDEPSSRTLQFDFDGDDAELSGLLARMIDRGLPVVSFSEERGDLEDVFLHVTRGAADESQNSQ